MKKMGLNQIREEYLKYFESKNHLRMKSFSLVPENDPSILLINAGMTPLKPFFTGAQIPPSKRVTTCQKCIRTPDIERVGKTSRHGTFFEMLGNFSFGDYFKEDTIKWAWEFCTEVLEMPKEKLSVSVYEEDDEAYDIWKSIIGLPESKIFKLGKEDNFWEHGLGPCGPDSEIFYDRGEDKGCKSPDCKVGCDCDRFVEFWNLVFTQFNKEEDGSYTTLDKKNIDTGGGLERFACIMQDVDNLFEVDTVRKILDYVCKITKTEYGKNHADDTAIRVITDHARSAVMMIGDKILPDNASRGYVLRRLIRRAARFGMILGTDKPFLHDVAEVVINGFEDAYPELVENKDFIKSVILREEESFAKTVKQGMSILNDHIKEIKSQNKDTLAGDMVFKLHDTFGFPLDLTREIASENNCKIDEEGFKKEMQQQKVNARENALKNKAGAAWSGKELPQEFANFSKTEFLGYEKLETEAKIDAIILNQESLSAVNEVGPGDDIIILTSKTPFYAESGGQSADTGLIEAKDFIIEVNDVKKTSNAVVMHFGTVKKGNPKVGQIAKFQVDENQRMATARNHTTTHILHKALQAVLGDHVKQAGSDVNPNRLRFDFSHFEALTQEQKENIEKIVNEQILADKKVNTTVMSIDEAKGQGAMALFDEKYEDEVRVVSVGDFSKELCGGTHLERSSQACIFKLVSESAVAAGVRRIEGVTGQGAMEILANQEQLLRKASGMVKSSFDEIPERIITLQEKIKTLDKSLELKSKELAKISSQALKQKAIKVDDLQLLFEVVESDNADELRNLADFLKDKIEEGVIVLGSAHGQKVSIVSMATKSALKKGAHAGKIVGAAAKIVSGGGGGRPDMAQAGGKDPSKLAQAIEHAKSVCFEQLNVK